MKTIPSDNINSTSAITGNSNKYHDKPIPLPIKKIKIIIHEIKKLTNPLTTTDIGNISLGK